CDFRPDVLEALFRFDFGFTATPYKTHQLPDTIYCVDYDFGSEGVAYHDADYQVVHGLGSEESNRGGKYRNDGVDIELSNDPAGARYNVGWIEKGEWLLFTVAIKDSGEYGIEFRVASPSSTRRLQLLLNNQPLTGSIKVPNTGGWKNWQTFSPAEKYSLPAGTHLLKLLFLESGFNINFLKFNLKSIPTKESYRFDQITDTVFLAQNYPNPFNQITQIPVLLLEPQTVNLKIFNLNGALVKDVFDGLLATGLQTIAWNGTNSNRQPVSSGLYLYQFNVNGSQKTKMMILQK
ncbi:MAG TPA: carbohydrate-binding protein, partial [bacterium]